MNRVECRSYQALVYISNRDKNVFYYHLNLNCSKRESETVRVNKWVSKRETLRSLTNSVLEM